MRNFGTTKNLTSCLTPVLKTFTRFFKRFPTVQKCTIMYKMYKNVKCTSTIFFIMVYCFYWVQKSNENLSKIVEFVTSRPWLSGMLHLADMQMSLVSLIRLYKKGLFGSVCMICLLHKYIGLYCMYMESQIFSFLYISL